MFHQNLYLCLTVSLTIDMGQLLHFSKIISRYVQNTIPDIPPHVTPHIPCIKGIKAVAFDIYGTLLHSASGEISTGEIAEKLQIEFPHLSLSLDSKMISAILKREIQKQHSVKHAQGIRYPEVDIVKIWEKILQKENPFSKAVANYRMIRECAMETALYYELQVNPVSPMPHAFTIIHRLHNAGIALGIVSNAQFYTAHVLEYLSSKANKTNNTTQRYKKLFDLFSTCVWSYMLGEGKPSPRLYEKLLYTWSDYKPHEILFVGNDMRNDIAAPATLGIKTVLFAGDSQSYRLRETLQELVSIKPDACITNLMSITDIVGIT